MAKKIHIGATFANSLLGFDIEFVKNPILRSAA